MHKILVSDDQKVEVCLVASLQPLAKAKETPEVRGSPLLGKRRLDANKVIRVQQLNTFEVRQLENLAVAPSPRAELQVRLQQRWIRHPARLLVDSNLGNFGVDQ